MVILLVVVVTILVKHRGCLVLAGRAEKFHGPEVRGPPTAGMTPPASVTSRTGSRRTPSSQGGVTLFARRLSLLALLTVVVAGGAGATTSAALPSPALEAKVVSIQLPAPILAYP